MVDVFVEKPQMPSSVLPPDDPLTESAQNVLAKNEEKHIVSKPKKAVSHAPGMFTSYSESPNGITFSSQGDKEIIYLLLRRHFITNIPWLSTMIVLLLLPLLVIGVFHITNPLTLFLPNGIPGRYALIGLLFYYLAVITTSFVSFLSWFYSISLITSEQIFDIDFSSLVYKEVSGTRMHLVEDVKATQIGSFRSFFDYGDILVQTAGAVDNFMMPAIPHPTQVENLIGRLLGKEEAEQEDKENDHD